MTTRAGSRNPWRTACQSPEAVGARLDMTTQGGRPALHNGARGSADVAGERMGLLVGGKRVLEDGLQGHEGHRGLRTRERSKVGWVSLQYHANHPRDKRLVQRRICQPNGDCSEHTGLPPTDVYRIVRVLTFERGGQPDVRSR